jgi:hypothetical protein
MLEIEIVHTSPADGVYRTEVTVNGIKENIYSEFAPIYDKPLDDWLHGCAGFGGLSPVLKDYSRGGSYNLTFKGSEEDCNKITAAGIPVSFVNLFSEKTDKLIEEFTAFLDRTAVIKQKDPRFPGPKPILYTISDAVAIINALSRFKTKIDEYISYGETLDERIALLKAMPIEDCDDALLCRFQKERIDFKNNSTRAAYAVELIKDIRGRYSWIIS